MHIPMVVCSNVVICARKVMMKVMIGIITASVNCHMACMFKPLNSFFPVSVSMRCVAAMTLPSVFLMWVVRSPLLFIISPRYLNVGTSSRVVPLSTRELLGPLPILITLHLAAPNSMWYFLAIWLVMSSIFWSLFLSWWIRHTSSIHSRESIITSLSVSMPRILFCSSLAILSISVAYSMTDSTPPCLMLSLISIGSVRPYLVWILDVQEDYICCFTLHSGFVDCLFQCYEVITGCVAWGAPCLRSCDFNMLFMPPPLGARGIMFSCCPSVRPKPEIPSFDLYMGPLVHPTNRNRYTACPSVRLSVRLSGEVSGHLLENAWRVWPEILHADVSWPSPELISLWPLSVDFSNFGTILTWWNESNLGFLGISRRTHGGNGLKFCTLMYLDHFQNWLVYGHSLLIFSCDQAALQMVFSVCPSVCPSVCLSHLFSCDQAALWMVQSVRPSVRLSVRLSVCHTFLTMFPSSHHHEIFRSCYQWPKWRPCKRSRSEVKGQGHWGQQPT